MLWEPIGQEQRHLMRALKQNSAELDWQGALGVLQSIPESPGPEWVPVYRSVLQCLCKAARYEEAHQLWSQIPKRDIMSYNTMLNLCARLRKTEEAVQLRKQMEADGVEPTGITLVTMIKVWAEAGDWEQAIRDLEAIKKTNLDFSGELAYLHTMKACERAGQAQKALELFQELSSGSHASSRPQAMHYNVLLHAHREDPVKCKALFDEMRQAGHRPRSRDYRAVMVAYRHSFEECKRIYQDLKSDLGELPDEDVFEALINSARFCRDAAGARWVLEEMRSVGLNPDQPKLPALRRALTAAEPLLEGRTPAFGYGSDSLSAAAGRQSQAQPAGPGSAVPAPLPLGWAAALDPNTGVQYYWRMDNPAATTTWERPV